MHRRIRPAAPRRLLALAATGALAFSAVGCSDTAEESASKLQEANVSEAKRVLEEVAMTRAPYRELDRRCRDLVPDVSTAVSASVATPEVSGDETSTASGSSLPVERRRCTFAVGGGGTVDVEVQVSPQGSPVTPELLAAWRGESLGGVPLEGLGTAATVDGTQVLALGGGPDRGLVVRVQRDEPLDLAEQAGLARTVVTALGSQ